MKISLKVTSCAAALLIICDSPYLAADKHERSTLKDLQHVAVVIGKLEKEVRNDGLRLQQLRTDVESRLRMVGMKIIDRGHTTRPYGPARLYVKVDAEKTKYCGYALSVRVELHQSVLLLHGSRDSVSATTWHTSLAGMVPVHKMPHTVRAWLVDIVDQFVNDHSAANQEKGVVK